MDLELLLGLNRSMILESTRMLVSVIIPAKNAEPFIKDCLDSLAQINLPHERWEVIVVDNGSIDRTVAIAGGYAGCLNLRIAHWRGGTISSVRNAGASLARGEVFAFLDADCNVHPDWLKNALELYSPGKLLGAFYRIPPRSSWIARTWYGYEMAEKVGAVPFVPSGDMILARETFVKIGGFDETIETNEDYEICQRAHAAGIEVLARPIIAVTHIGTPQNLKSFYEKQRWHGKHVMAVTLRSLPALRNVKAISFSFYVLACSLCILAGLPMAWRRQGTMLLGIGTIALVSAPALLSARLSLRRKRLADWLPLAFLFLVYGFARAVCLLDIKEFVTASSSRVEDRAVTGYFK